MMLEVYLIFQIILILFFIVSILFNEEILMVCSSVLSIILMVLTFTISNILQQKIFFYINASIFLVSFLFTVIIFVDKYQYYKIHNKIGDKKCY